MFPLKSSLQHLFPKAVLQIPFILPSPPLEDSWMVMGKEEEEKEEEEEEEEEEGRELTNFNHTTRPSFLPLHRPLFILSLLLLLFYTYGRSQSVSQCFKSLPLSLLLLFNTYEGRESHSVTSHYYYRVKRGSGRVG